MFLQVFQTYVPSISVVSIRMLQVFHLDVLKVDLMLQQVFHMYVSCLQTYLASVASGCFKSRSSVASASSLSAASPLCLLLLPAPTGHPPPLLPLLDASDGLQAWASRRLSIQALASPLAKKHKES